VLLLSGEDVEAAAKLGLLRRDAEARGVDGLVVSLLRAGGREELLREWLRGVARCLLDPLAGADAAAFGAVAATAAESPAAGRRAPPPPADALDPGPAAPGEGGGGGRSGAGLARLLARAVSDRGETEEARAAWFGRSTQEQRFAFFRAKVLAIGTWCKSGELPLAREAQNRPQNRRVN
jgi:hypothetical protein